MVFFQVNGPASPFRAGKSTERRNIHQKVAQGPWANTWGLDCAELGKPIIDLVQRQISWERYMGQPMAQKVPGEREIFFCVYVFCANFTIRLIIIYIYSPITKFLVIISCVDI